jgi:hypothetical protein
MWGCNGRYRKNTEFAVSKVCGEISTIEAALLVVYFSALLGRLVCINNLPCYVL